MGRFAWKKDRWEKEKYGGDESEMVPVSGLRYGNWGVFKDGSNWAAGLITVFGRRAVETKTRKEAMAFVEALGEANPAYLTLKDINEFNRHVQGILKIRNNPKLWKKSGKPSLAEATATVQQILSSNLKPLGTYSGKAGEFWGIKKSGDKVGRAISLGSKEVMLNSFFVEQRPGDKKQGSRWQMEDIKLITKMAMEERVLMAWIKWVKAGPTMKEIRQNVRMQEARGDQYPQANGGMRLASRVISRVARRHVARTTEAAAIKLPPKRRGGYVKCLKRVQLLTDRGSKDVTVPPRAVGVVERREWDYGGRSVALMDQLGPAYEGEGPKGSFQYTIRFPGSIIPEDDKLYVPTEKDGSVLLVAHDWEFVQGYLKVGR